VGSNAFKEAGGIEIGELALVAFGECGGFCRHLIHVAGKRRVVGARVEGGEIPFGERSELLSVAGGIAGVEAGFWVHRFSPKAAAPSRPRRSGKGCRATEDPPRGGSARLEIPTSR